MAELRDSAGDPLDPEASRSGIASSLRRTVLRQPLRCLGALLLLACLALPLGTCSYHVDASGQPTVVEDPDQVPEDVERIRQWSFALEGFPTDTLAWLSLLALAWPALATAFLVWKPWGRGAAVVRILEVPLMVFSIALVEFLATFFVSRAFGAYVAFTGAAVYCVGALSDDVTAVRDWLRKRQRGTTS